MRKAKIFYKNHLCGELIEDDLEYIFTYDSEYLKKVDAKPISLLLPLTNAPYHSNVLFPFFDGLIPEGYLEDVAIKKWNISYSDRFGILLKTGNNTIGAVKVVEE